METIKRNATRKKHVSGAQKRLIWVKASEDVYKTMHVWQNEDGDEYQGMIIVSQCTIKIKNFKRNKYVVKVFEGANLRTLQRKAKRMFRALKVKFDVEIRAI